MSQGPLCPNLTKKFQKEVSQIANRNSPCVMLLGGLSVNLNHLKMNDCLKQISMLPTTKSIIAEKIINAEKMKIKDY